MFYDMIIKPILDPLGQYSWSFHPELLDLDISLKVLSLEALIVTINVTICFGLAGCFYLFESGLRKGSIEIGLIIKNRKKVG